MYSVPDIKSVTKISYDEYGNLGIPSLFRQKDSPVITFKRNRIRHWPVSSFTGLDNFKIQLHGGNYYGSTAQFNSYEL